MTEILYFSFVFNDNDPFLNFLLIRLFCFDSGDCVHFLWQFSMFSAILDSRFMKVQEEQKIFGLSIRIGGSDSSERRCMRFSRSLPLWHFLSALNVIFKGSHSYKSPDNVNTRQLYIILLHQTIQANYTLWTCSRWRQLSNLSILYAFGGLLVVLFLFEGRTHDRSALPPKAWRMGSAIDCCPNLTHRGGKCKCRQSPPCEQSTLW